MVANRVDNEPRIIRLEDETIEQWRTKTKVEYDNLLTKKERLANWFIETIPLKVIERGYVNLDAMRLLEEVSIYKVSTGRWYDYGVYVVAEGWNGYQGGYKPGGGKPAGSRTVGETPFNFRITTGQDKLIQKLAKQIPSIKKRNRSERFRYFVEIGIDKVIQDEAYRSIGRAPIGTSIPTVEGVRLSKEYHSAAIAIQARYDLSDYKLIQLALQVGIAYEVERLGLNLSEIELEESFF